MKTTNQLKNEIVKVIAQDLGNGFFSIEAEIAGEDNLILLPKSKRVPVAAQLFTERANGNCNKDSYGKFFTFSKSTKNVMYPSQHLKSFLVEAA